MQYSRLLLEGTGCFQKCILTQDRIVCWTKMVVFVGEAFSPFSPSFAVLEVEISKIRTEGCKAAGHYKAAGDEVHVNCV